MTKDSVLMMLRREDGYISGERISAALGVSRAAVNAAVKALRADGYEIHSMTNRGYCLRSAPDRLTAGSCWRICRKSGCRASSASTRWTPLNRRLRELAYDGAPDGQVVLANEQTQGRGRLGRGFLSPRIRGIYLSILLRPEGTPAGTTAVTAWTAVAVQRAIRKRAALTPRSNGSTIWC